MMINKIELHPVSFLFRLQRLCQTFVPKRARLMESRISSIIVGFVGAYVLLKVVPAISHITLGKWMYWLLLFTLTLYLLGLRQFLANHPASNMLRTSIQNVQLRRANHQLRQSLHGQEVLKQSLEAENQRLYRLATVDELTQIFNRRFLDQQLDQEWRQQQQAACPLSVILFDVDYFKLYNDYYGHLAGDSCLYEIAQSVQRSLQGEAGFVARYGGEEFAVVLPNTNEHGAVAIAQTIQRAIHGLAIPHAQSDVNDLVTVSLGIATIVPLPESSWKALVDQADQALYEAKRQGRDRYIFKSYFRRCSANVE